MADLKSGRRVVSIAEKATVLCNLTECASGSSVVMEEHVQVLFAEVMTLGVSASGEVGLRKLSEGATPASLVALSGAIERLDAVVGRCGVYKVETIGSEFMAVSGLPAACPQPRNTSQRMLRAALAMLQSVRAAGIENVSACDFLLVDTSITLCRRCASKSAWRRVPLSRRFSAAGCFPAGSCLGTPSTRHRGATCGSMR